MKTIFTFLLCFFLTNISAQDWKTFTNHKEVLDIEKQGNILWIATAGGLLKWDLQTGNYSKLTTEHGLISNHINAITIADDNKRWLATNRGVSVLDVSENIINYTSDDGLYNDNVKAVVIDSEGNKWFATNENYGPSGLAKLDSEGNWSSIPESYDYPMKCLAVDASDNIYIGMYQRIMKYTSDGNWEEFVAPSTDGIGHVREMVIDENQELWAVSGVGLFHFDSNGNKTLFNMDDGLMSYPTSLFIDSNNTKWIGTFEGVSKMNLDDSFTNYTLEEEVITIFEENENILLGTENDITVFSGNNVLGKLITETELAANAVRDLDISDDGSVWMGTEKGISQFTSNNEWINFTQNEGLICDSGYSLLATSNDELMVSHQTSCSGISFIDIPSGSVDFIQNSTFGFTLSLNEDLNENIWVGYYSPFSSNGNYAAKIAPDGNLTFFDFTDVLPNTSNNKTTGIAIHPNGNVYFSTRYGLYYVDVNDELHFFKLEFASTIFIDSQENIWFAEGDFWAPNHSLEKYTPTDDHIEYQNDEINNYVIHEITEDAQGNIWIASENGLFKLSPDEIFTRYTTQDGLADNNVTGIQFDGNGNMWISTMNGVSTTATISTPTTNLENKTIQIQLSPNPTVATATLTFDLEKNESVRVEIFNVAGQMMLSPFDGNKLAGKNQIEFDVHDFPQGIYFCKIKLSGNEQVLKFIKM